MVDSFPTPGRNLLSCRCARPDHPLVTGVCAHSPVQLSRNFMAPLSRYSLVRQVETAGAAAAAGHWWSPASCFACGLLRHGGLLGCSLLRYGCLLCHCSLGDSLGNGIPDGGPEHTRPFLARSGICVVARPGIGRRRTYRRKTERGDGGAGQKESAVREHGLPPLRPVGNVASGHRHPSGFASSAM